MSNPSEIDRAKRQMAWVLGAAGLLPFFGNAWFAWLVPVSEADGALRSQAHYAGAIITFLGALHWGVVLAAARPFASGDGMRLVWGVMPAIFAWIVTLYPVSIALPALCFALPLVLVVDLLLHRSTPVPRWFLGLRVVLTLGATACVAASWAAMVVRKVG